MKSFICISCGKRKSLTDDCDVTLLCDSCRVGTDNWLDDLDDYYNGINQKNDYRDNSPLGERDDG